MFSSFTNYVKASKSQFFNFLKSPLPKILPYAGAPVGMCTWGHVHTKFCQPPQPYLNQEGGADYAHPILVSTPSFESHRRACYDARAEFYQIFCSFFGQEKMLLIFVDVLSLLFWILQWSSLILWPIYYFGIL